MPRTISAASLAKLATQYGTEPINILEIQWVADGTRIGYADRDISGGIQGRILEVSGLDAVINVSGGGQSQQISVTLDDTDGTIKTIIDTNDIHKRSCWVYQWFEGIPTADKFLIFKGEINSPVEWDEGARTIRFDVIAKIEDVEVGFSIEEGNFVDPPEELIGRPWPLCFGTCINVPALRAQSIRQGTLATGVGIRDFTLEKRLQLANRIICPQNFIGFEMRYDDGNYRSLLIFPVYEEDKDCAKSKCEIIELLELQLSEQRDFEHDEIRIFGGDKFPQNVEITLDINGGKFTGQFNGEVFTIKHRLHPDLDTTTGEKTESETERTIISECGGRGVDLSAFITGAEGELTDGELGTDKVLLAKRSKLSWDAYNAIKPSEFFWANAGSTVTIDSDQEIIYIANILPSTVLRVAAWRELDGSRKLLTVPTAYYTVREVDYTGYDVTEILLTRPLSGRAPGWSDDIYVTLTSSIGPNTVDIIEWFIGKYTSYTVDATSFNDVRTKIDNYPMHFPLLERKNIINVLEEIAFQARCALWLKDDVFYIKYLAEEPTSDGTITESDVFANTLKVFHTPTEALVTKLTTEWKKDYAINDPNKLILRHNVAKYGTHEKTYDFYCFNILELVRKAATFWLIRKSNTWRKASFSTPIHKLKHEVFDTLSLTLPDVAPGTIKTIVEQANFDSDSHMIQFEVWTPIKSGTQTPYDFAWPAAVSEQSIFPTLEERDLGFAGAGTGPNFTTIAPNEHPLRLDRPALPQGFTLGCNGAAVASLTEGCRSDHGDKKPSDIGDTKPTPKAAQDQAGEINTGTSPITSGRGEGQNCCQAAQDALRIAKQAQQEAQTARAEAQNANKNAGGDEEEPVEEDEVDDALSKLPKECGGNCTAKFRVTRIIPTLVRDAELFFHSDTGDSGSLVLGNQTTETCHTFNSHTAMTAFLIAKQAEIDARGASLGWVVGEEADWLIGDADADLGIDEETGQICTEPDAAERAQVGYQTGL